MRLDQLAVAAYRDGRRMGAPLLGYPGVQLTGSTIRQNTFNSELHARSLQALAERFRPDLLFFMMNLSLEAGALGLPVRYPLQESASVEEHPVRRASDLEQFRQIDPLADALIQAHIDTMRRMKDLLPAGILRGGYVVGPFTLAGLLMGATSLALATVEQPELVTEVVEFARGVVEAYGRELVKAGAQVIAILEPTATFLSPAAFRKFAGRADRQVIQALQEESSRKAATAGEEVMTILHICGDAGHLVEAMAETGAQGLSLDSDVDLAAAARRVPADVVLVGNIDPVAVMGAGDQEAVAAAVEHLLEAMDPYPNFILSTGCDLPWNTPLANVETFMRAGRGWRRQAGHDK